MECKIDKSGMKMTYKINEEKLKEILIEHFDEFCEEKRKYDYTRCEKILECFGLEVEDDRIYLGDTINEVGDSLSDIVDALNNERRNTLNSSCGDFIYALLKNNY